MWASTHTHKKRRQFTIPIFWQHSAPHSNKSAIVKNPLAHEMKNQRARHECRFGGFFISCAPSKMNSVYTELRFTSRLTFKWSKNSSFASNWTIRRERERGRPSFADCGKHFSSMFAFRIDNLKFIFLTRGHNFRAEVAGARCEEMAGADGISRVLSKVFLPPLIHCVRND